jgi:hypothetical protein
MQGQQEQTNLENENLKNNLSTVVLFFRCNCAKGGFV